MKIRNFLIFLCMWMTFVNVAKSEKIAVAPGNPPFMYVVNGEAKGFYPLIVTKIFERINVPLEIKALPWNRAICYADEGKMGIVGIYKNKERLRKYDYSEAIFEDQVMIYVLKENEFEYKETDDLEGKKVGVIRGWSYGEEFDMLKGMECFCVDEVNYDDVNFTKLIGGRLDCVLAIKETGDYLMNINPEYKAKIVPLEKPLLITSTYLIFPKYLQKKELLEKFNKELKKMKDSSEFENLIKEYLSE